MKIQSKILSGFFLLIILVIAIGIIAVHSTRSLDKKFTALSQETLPVNLALQELKYGGAMVVGVASECVLLACELQQMEPGPDRAAAQAALVEEKEEFDSSIKILERALTDWRLQVNHYLPDEEKFLSLLQTQTHTLAAVGSELVHLAEQEENPGTSILAAKKKFEQAEHLFYQQLNKMIGQERNELERRVNEVHRYSDDSSKFIFICVVLLIILVIIASVIISRHIAMPIIRLEQTARKVARGDLGARANISSDDEIGSLSMTFDSMVGELEQLNSGLSGMVDKRTAALTQSNLALQKEVQDRMIAEEKARQNSATINNIFNNAIPMCITNADFEIVRANQAYDNVFGRINTGNRPVKCYESRPGPSCQTEKCPLVRVMTEGGKVTCETRKEENNHERFFIVTARPFKNADGEITGIVESFQDITDRKQAEDKLAEEKELLAVTLQSIGDGVITTDTHGNIILLNKEAQKMTGWGQEEALGKPLEEVFHIVSEKNRSRHENPAEKVLRTGQIIELANHTILIAKDGWERFIADSGAPIHNKKAEIIGVVIVFRDVTEKQRMEREVAKVEKLQSIGILAGGIAHDFNNILTALIGNITLAKMYSKPDDKVFDRLAKSENAIIKAKDLTQQLLTFSKGGAPMRKAVSINELIRDTVSFTLRGSKSNYQFSFDDHLNLADVDSGQINQVISNLVINADQAMTEGGTITIKAENHEIGEEDIRPLHPGQYLKISISDTGKGIPREILPLIFDPYFTTKQDGSGLGLASVYSIVNHHDGYISVDSTLGHGTTFTIYLPASIEKTHHKRLPNNNAIRGNGKILVMDDDNEIREMLNEVLTTLGYSVVLTVDGNDALDNYREAMKSDEPFNAVILDLTIPGGMGGKVTMNRLVAMDPGIKAIVSSGYSSDPVMANYQEYGFSAVVSKPYKVGELSQVLNDVLMIDRKV